MKSCGSSGAIVPASTSASQLITRRQNGSPKSRIGSRPHPAGLDQRQHLEELVEGAEAAGKDRDRLGAHQEVHLADGEIVEVEAEVGRAVEVRAPARAAARC